MTISEGKPWRSFNARVHPEHVKDMNNYLKDVGVRGAEFAPNGEMIAYSRKARAKALDACGWHDKDGGYTETV